MKCFARIAFVVLFAGVPFIAHNVLAQDKPLTTENVPAQGAEQPPATPITTKHFAKDVLIGPGDRLNIIATNFEKITKEWTVGSSGDLNLPLIGVVHAAGKTIGELETELETRSAKYIKEPHVTVHLVELRSQPVNVTGSVDKPGIYQLAGSKNLFEVMLLAGAPKGTGQTITVRRNAELDSFDIPGVSEYVDGGVRSITLNVTEVMSGRGDQAGLEILPRDTILVSAAPPPRYVQITGEVPRPGAIELVSKDNISLMQVVAIAGGATNLANKGNTLIWHINDDGFRSDQFISVDLAKIEKGEAKDLSLTAGDIVLIQRSGMKVLLQTATIALFSTGISSTILVLSRI
jgi:polysaccharide export outer membrane protein